MNRDFKPKEHEQGSYGRRSSLILTYSIYFKCNEVPVSNWNMVYSEAKQ